MERSARETREGRGQQAPLHPVQGVPWPPKGADLACTLSTMPSFSCCVEIAKDTSRIAAFQTQRHDMGTSGRKEEEASSSPTTWQGKSPRRWGPIFLSHRKVL